MDKNHWSQKPFCCQVYESCIEWSLWTCSCVECKFLCFTFWGALHFKVFTQIISGNVSPMLFYFGGVITLCVIIITWSLIYDESVFEGKKQTRADYTDYIIVILFYTRDGNIMTIKMTLYVVYWCIVFGIEYEISVKGGKKTSIMLNSQASARL